MTVNKSMFIDQFRVMDRLENFSVEAREMLFDYLEEYEESCIDYIEMDIIAVCCEYSEDTVKEIAENYSIGVSDCTDDDEMRAKVLEYLEKNTYVVGETPSETDTRDSISN